MVIVKAYRSWAKARPGPQTLSFARGRVHASPNENTDVANHAAITGLEFQLLDNVRAGACASLYAQVQT